MSAAATDKAGWLEHLERTRATWEAIVAEVGEAEMVRPGAMGDWTFKDVAAHLNGWRVRTVDRLEAAARNEAPPPPPWPAELDDDTDAGVDAINRWFYERSRDRPATEVLAEARDQFRRMRVAVEAVPEEDLLTSGRFSWLGDYPLSAVLQGSSEHLYEEHEPDLRAWLAGRSH
jgi:hypothetical protein